MEDDFFHSRYAGTYRADDQNLYSIVDPNGYNGVQSFDKCRGAPTWARQADTKIPHLTAFTGDGLGDFCVARTRGTFRDSRYCIP